MINIDAKKSLLSLAVMSGLLLTGCGADTEDDKKSNSKTEEVRPAKDVDISISDVTVSEGDSVEKEVSATVNLSSPHESSVIEVDYIVEDGSAINGEDYIAKSGTLVIPALTDKSQIRFTVIGDSRYEDNENFTITLVAARNATIIARKSKSVVTIKNDDKEPTIDFDVDYLTANEGGSVSVGLSLSNESDFEVSAQLVFDGTANYGDDYTYEGEREIVFAKGETKKEILLTINEDSIPEGGEIISVSLEQISGAVIAPVRGVKDPVVKAQVLILGDVALNDTGLTRYSDGVNIVDLEPSDLPNQDASYGRDANSSTNTAADGIAGFSFTKLDKSGNPLPPNAAEWYCIEDSVTGLVWENKSEHYELSEMEYDAESETSSLPQLSYLESRAGNFTYTWHKSDLSDTGGSKGSARGKQELVDKKTSFRGAGCGYSSIPDRKFKLYCDSEAYVEEINYQGVCGFTDWRVPEINELKSIADYNRTGGTFKPEDRFFPNMTSRNYLSTTPSSNNDASAWCFNFTEGSTQLCNKLHSDSNLVLVRNKK